MRSLIFLSLFLFSKFTQAQPTNPYYYDFLLAPQNSMATINYLSGLNDFDNTNYNNTFKTKETLLELSYMRGFKSDFHAGIKLGLTELEYDKGDHRSESALKDLEFQGKWLIKQTDTGLIFIKPYAHLPLATRDLDGSNPDGLEGNGVRGQFILGSTVDFQFRFDRIQAVGFVGLEYNEGQKLKGDNITFELPQRIGPQWGLKAQFIPLEDLTLSVAKIFSRYQRSFVHYSQPFEGKEQDTLELSIGFHLLQVHNLELGYRKIQNTLRLPGKSSEIVATSDSSWIGYSYQF